MSGTFPGAEALSASEPASRVDPITLSVIWGALQSVTVEVGTTVHRTAHSQQAREGQDFSVCLFDPEGRMVAQGPYSPGHMGAMSFAAKNAVQAFPGDRLRPGDVVLFNSPFLGSGHFPDFFMIQPAFTDDGRLIGFAANILHHTDVGGMRPGSQAVEGVFDYFQEGLHVPPVKPWKEGKEQEDVLAIILANTRMADSMLGDLRAQRNSLRVGELRMVELARRYGHETVQAAMAEIMDRTEAKVRQAIRTIPNGVYPVRGLHGRLGTRDRADAPGGDGHRAGRRHPDRLRRHGARRPSRG